MVGKWETIAVVKKRNAYLLFREGSPVIGALFEDREAHELEYLLKKEMEELSAEIEEPDLNHLVKRVMEERYRLLFTIYKRFAPEQECIRYLRR
jgi:hypothetical protein